MNRTSQLNAIGIVLSLTLMGCVGGRPVVESPSIRPDVLLLDQRDWISVMLREDAARTDSIEAGLQGPDGRAFYFSNSVVEGAERLIAERRRLEPSRRSDSFIVLPETPLSVPVRAVSAKPIGPAGRTTITAAVNANGSIGVPESFGASGKMEAVYRYNADEQEFEVSYTLSIGDLFDAGLYDFNASGLPYSVFLLIEMTERGAVEAQGSISGGLLFGTATGAASTSGSSAHEILARDCLYRVRLAPSLEVGKLVQTDNRIFERRYRGTLMELPTLPEVMEAQAQSGILAEANPSPVLELVLFDSRTDPPRGVRARVWEFDVHDKTKGINSRYELARVQPIAPTRPAAGWDRVGVVIKGEEIVQLRRGESAILSSQHQRPLQPGEPLAADELLGTSVYIVSYSVAGEFTWSVVRDWVGKQTFIKLVP